MLQIGGELDLLQEPLRTKYRRELRVQNLYGHLAVVPDVFGQVNRRHAARAQFALDAISIGQR